MPFVVGEMQLDVAERTVRIVHAHVHSPTHVAFLVPKAQNNPAEHLLSGLKETH